jgi:hypothetical protein
MAQTMAPASMQSPAAAAPLAMPTMMGPLSTAPPVTFDAGPFGILDVTGILSGLGYWQGHPGTGDQAASADISNGQVFVQKATGVVQFYLQAGAYNLPMLGMPFFSTSDTVRDFFGALPQAYLKLAPKGSFSFLIGKLPSLIGTEYTFDFENLNIERGLLWNQENDINRGIQVNYSKGKLAASLSWNDGFYSNRYNWISGQATYTSSASNSYEFAAGGNYGTTVHSSIATPVFQNNSSIYDLIYTHTARKWMLGPYIQYTYVPLDARIGAAKATSTMGVAVLGSYTLGPHISLAGRAEYIGSSGDRSDGSANLLYGPGSGAWSITATPTYQNKAFFARAEFSMTKATSYTLGDAFGPHGADPGQARGLIESGFMF